MYTCHTDMNKKFRAYIDFCCGTADTRIHFVAFILIKKIILITFYVIYRIDE